jgi:hypothetical protein
MWFWFQGLIMFAVNSEKAAGESNQYRHTQDPCRLYVGLNWMLNCGLRGLKSRTAGNPWRGLYVGLFELRSLQQWIFNFRHIIASLRSSPDALSSSSN